MKKKLMVGVLAAALAVGMVMAFTACGANGSPESVIKAMLKAQLDYDVEKMIDLMYFEDQNDDGVLRYDLKAEIEELGLVGSSVKLTKFECTVTEATEEELEAAKALYEGINVEAVSKCEYTYSTEGSITVTIDGKEVEQDMNSQDAKGTTTVYKVDGKWYMEIIPAGLTNTGM